MKIYNASNTPFYKNHMYGKPIVDICLLLAFNHSSCLEIQRTFLRYGRIHVDRDTIRRYCKNAGKDKIRKYYNEFEKMINTPIKSPIDSKEKPIVRCLFGLNSLQEVQKKYCPSIFSKTDEKKSKMKNKNNKHLEEHLQRKIWKNYKIGQYRSVQLPLQLHNVLRIYSASPSDTLKRAIIDLYKEWRNGEREKVHDNLWNNPPPLSDKTISVSFAIKDHEHFNFIITLIKRYEVSSMRDFVLRSLSWYLRGKNLLGPPERRPKNIEFVKGIAKLARSKTCRAPCFQSLFILPKTLGIGFFIY